MEDKHYQVQAILNHKKEKNGTLSYWIKWKGWNDNYNSWIKAKDFDGFNLIDKYWKEKGKENTAKQKEARSKQRKTA